MILEVNHLAKEFRSDFFTKRTKVLNDLSFGVESGEIFGIAGPNGAGKTTTFKCLLGFINPTSGNIKIFERPQGDFRSRKYIGYLPENPYFYEYLTGFELLRYMGMLHGISGTTLRNKIDELLNSVNMTFSAKVQLRKYSKGMLQRIGIAQALINDPQLIILDEPMSGLDPIGRREVKDIILNLKKQGKTIILSTHILSDLEALCDKVCFLFKGKITKIGSIYEFYDQLNTRYEAVIQSKNLNVSFLSGIDGLDYRNIEDHIVVTFGEENKNSVIRLFLENNINILSLHPIRASLESIYEKYSEDSK